MFLFKKLHQTDKWTIVNQVHEGQASWPTISHNNRNQCRPDFEEKASHKYDSFTFTTQLQENIVKLLI